MKILEKQPIQKVLAIILSDYFLSNQNRKPIDSGKTIQQPKKETHSIDGYRKEYYHHCLISPFIIREYVACAGVSLGAWLHHCTPVDPLAPARALD